MASRNLSTSKATSSISPKSNSRNSPRATVHSPSVRSSLNLNRASKSKSSASRYRSSKVKFRPSTSRSEEHTSELQSRGQLVCRLLLEKKMSLFFFIYVYCNNYNDFIIIIRVHLTSTLFPYTTLFRSYHRRAIQEIPRERPSIRQASVLHST